MRGSGGSVVVFPRLMQFGRPSSLTSSDLAYDQRSSRQRRCVTNERLLRYLCVARWRKVENIVPIDHARPFRKAPPPLSLLVVISYFLSSSLSTRDTGAMWGGSARDPTGFLVGDDELLYLLLCQRFPAKSTINGNTREYRSTHTTRGRPSGPVGRWMGGRVFAAHLEPHLSSLCPAAW